MEQLIPEEYHEFCPSSIKWSLKDFPHTNHMITKSPCKTASHPHLDQFTVCQERNYRCQKSELKRCCRKDSSDHRHHHAEPRCYLYLNPMEAQDYVWITDDWTKEQ
jgi:hypothetical protein